jgi:hypothetical protein
VHLLSFVVIPRYCFVFFFSYFSFLLALNWLLGGGWAGWFLVSALFYIQGSLLFVLFCFSHCLGTASIRKIVSCFHIFDGFGFGKKVSCYHIFSYLRRPFFYLNYARCTSSTHQYPLCLSPSLSLCPCMSLFFVCQGIFLIKATGESRWVGWMM